MIPVQEVLQTWRAAERVLEALPASDPHQEDVELAISKLRRIYQQLVDYGPPSAEVLASVTWQLDEAHALLGRLTAVTPPMEPRPDALVLG
jgi:hypothetical protein